MRSIRTVSVLASLLAAAVVPSASMAQILGIGVGISLNITVAPPELPVYEQPPIPAPGYIFTPGYWHYGADGYYWVPGTWVQPPAVGLLWTPGHWGWRDGVYVFNEGYWGQHVGFYGGVNYGFGYGGVGFEGGRWNNGVLVYNRSVNNFGGVTVTNVYNQTVIVNPSASRVSFNGGTGGITAQPTPQEQAVAAEPHQAATPMQAQHQQAASTNKALLASTNGGHPAVAATAKPGEFTGKGVVAAHEAKPGPATPNAAAAAKPPGAPAAKTPPNAVGAKTPPTAVGALDKKPPTNQPGAKPPASAAAKPAGSPAEGNKPVENAKEHANATEHEPAAKPPAAAAPKAAPPAPPHPAAAPAPHPVAAAAAKPKPPAKPGAPPEKKPPG